ncbi:MAG: phosphotransferase [Planctomycetota bacterium]
MNHGLEAAALESERSKPLASASFTWLPGEASGRRYARLVQPRRYELATAIAMLFPRGTPADEVRRVVRSTELLGQAGIPVPVIHDSDAHAGWILQEDLGDETLARVLAAEGPRAERYYTEALTILERLHEIPSLATSPQPPLDTERLRRELQLFAETAISPGEAPGRALSDDLDTLVAACLHAPTLLCHRDYHARNLMVQGQRVRVLDHQDALLGPAPYDRVSLAFDPYVVLTDDLRDRLAGAEPHTGAVAVQRLCKAIGTYASKGAEWRQWMAPAARQARRLMQRHALRLPVLEAALAPLSLAVP